MSAEYEYTAYMWSVRDWRGDDIYRLLSLEEKGAYRELLDECWIHQKIPNDVDRLARIAGMAIDAFKRLWSLIKEKFYEISEGWLSSKRLEQDRERLDEIREKRARAGQVSSAKRYGKKVPPKPDRGANGSGRTGKKSPHADNTNQASVRDCLTSVTEQATHEPENLTRFTDIQINTKEKKKSKSCALADARRVPLKEFIFQEYEHRFSFKPPTDKSDWKHFESMLTSTRGSPAFELGNLMQYWQIFLRTKEAAVGHPIRLFSSNVTKYAAMANGGIHEERFPEESEAQRRVRNTREASLRLRSRFIEQNSGGISHRALGGNTGGLYRGAADDPDQGS